MCPDPAKWVTVTLVFVLDLSYNINAANNDIVTLYTNPNLSLKQFSFWGPAKNPLILDQVTYIHYFNTRFFFFMPTSFVVISYNLKY